MDIQSIKRIGFFDNITISGYLIPSYDTQGYILYTEKNFIESVNMTGCELCNNTPKIHLVLLGERDGKRFTIAYSDIIVIRDITVITSGKQKLGGKGKLNGDTTDIIDVTTHIGRNNHSKTGIKSAAVVDKVYVNEQYRKLGVSTWFHNNIYNMLKVLFNIEANLITLTYGDFSDEAATKFNMTFEEYKQYLRNMYIKLGYKDISIFSRAKLGIKSDILFKLVDNQ